MSRNTRPVEASILALLLGACATADRAAFVMLQIPVPEVASPPRIPEPPRPEPRRVLLRPDGVDYLTAVQCSALSAVFGELARNAEESSRLDLDAAVFGEWAEDSVLTPVREGVVEGDIAASRVDFRAATGSGSTSQRLAELESNYLVEARACRSFIDNAREGLLVVVGG